jgi:hypothetical protein
MAFAMHRPIDVLSSRCGLRLDRHHDKANRSTPDGARDPGAALANPGFPRDVELLSQTVGMFLRSWFAHTPPLPKEARHAASQNGEQRYRLLLERVGCSSPRASASPTTYRPSVVN